MSDIVLKKDLDSGYPPEPEERNGIRHCPPDGHLQPVFRRDRVRRKCPYMPQIARVPIVDIRDAAPNCADLSVGISRGRMMDVIHTYGDG